MFDLEDLERLLDELSPEESEKKARLKQWLSRWDKELDLLHELFVGSCTDGDVTDEFFSRVDEIYAGWEEENGADL